MIGRKNSACSLSSQGCVKSVLLESRKVLTLSVGSHCHGKWETSFGTFDKAAEGLPCFLKTLIGAVGTNKTKKNKNKKITVKLTNTVFQET